MKNVMGLVSLLKNDSLIKEFTEVRPIASIPIAGRYRVIDFALSNMVNSGIDSVGLMLPPKSRSLLDHLRSGKDWDLARRTQGLIYLPPMADDPQVGSLKACYDTIDFVENNKARYVLVSGGDCVFNMDYRKVLDYFQTTGADIVIVYTKAGDSVSGEGVVLRTAPDGTVIDIASRPAVHPAEKVSMGLFLMKKRTYMELVRYAYERGGKSFAQDVIMKATGDYAVFGYEHKGYVARINSTAAFYRANMDFLKPEVWEEIFMGERPIYTKNMDTAPAEYKGAAQVKGSLLANGATVRGTVENSIIFRGVKIGEGAVIKNSIIMQSSVIEAGARLENAILDKDVTITADKKLCGAPNYPIIVGKAITI